MLDAVPVAGCSLEVVPGPILCPLRVGAEMGDRRKCTQASGCAVAYGMQVLCTILGAMPELDPGTWRKPHPDLQPAWSRVNWSPNGKEPGKGMKQVPHGRHDR